MPARRRSVPGTCRSINHVALHIQTVMNIFAIIVRFTRRRIFRNRSLLASSARSASVPFIPAPQDAADCLLPSRHGPIWITFCALASPRRWIRRPHPSWFLPRRDFAATPGFASSGFAAVGHHRRIRRGGSVFVFVHVDRRYTAAFLALPPPPTNTFAARSLQLAENRHGGAAAARARFLVGVV